MKLVPLCGLHGNGKYAIVDDEDYGRVSAVRWFVHAGYARRRLMGTCANVSLMMHRFVNDTPPGMETDHINGNRLDNRRANLRTCSRVDNAKNRRRNRNNTSGARGVCWVPDRKRWRASIGLGGKVKFIGHYKTIDEASAAYESAAAASFGSFYRPPTTQDQLNVG